MNEEKSNLVRVPISADIVIGADGKVVSTEYQYVEVTREDYLNAMGELLFPYIKSKLADEGIYVERRKIVSEGAVAE